MKTVSLIFFMVITINASAQKYIISKKSGKFGLQTEAGDIFLKHKYQRIYKCKNSAVHYLAVD